MEEEKGVVKHLMLAEFKEGGPPEEIENLVKSCANLIKPMKGLKRGTELSVGNMNQGFTHVFETTFESTEGIAEFVAHPAHVELGKLMSTVVEKVLVLDYKPATLQLY